MEENLEQMVGSSPHQLQAWFQNVEDQLSGIEARIEDYKHRFHELFPKDTPRLSLESIKLPEDRSEEDSPPLSPIPLSRKDYIKSNIEALKWTKTKKDGGMQSKGRSPRLTPTKGML